MTHDTTNRFDASNNNQRTGGQWSDEEARLHINVKWLLAIFLALQSLVESRRGINVYLKMDKTYVNNMGGMHSQILYRTQVYILFQAKVMDLLRLARTRGLGKLMERESHDSISLAHKSDRISDALLALAMQGQ